MTFHIDIQHASDDVPITDDQLIKWANLTLKPYKDSAELTLRFVNIDEITHLNKTYRKIDKPTNVLAFPSNLPKEILLDYPLLGDVIICPEVLLQESKTLDTPLDAHWAHIIIHGILHLLGYDHISDADADIMQAIEITLLEQLGIDNPYKGKID